MGRGASAGRPSRSEDEMRKYTTKDAMLAAPTRSNPQSAAILGRVAQFGASINETRGEAVVVECEKQAVSQVVVPLRANHARSS